MDYKKTNAARTTISRDLQELSQKFNGNIYELITLLTKRANQIGVEIKDELIAKLDEFATPSDTLEEVFENQEQTEISRFYERLPKPTLIAIQELIEDNIYIREQIKEEEIELEDGEIDELEIENIVNSEEDSGKKDDSKEA
jgi:DNA-directed RNA polymerase subunit K/omega